MDLSFFPAKSSYFFLLAASRSHQIITNYFSPLAKYRSAAASIAPLCVRSAKLTTIPTACLVNRPGRNCLLQLLVVLYRCQVVRKLAASAVAATAATGEPIGCPGLLLVGPTHLPLLNEKYQYWGDVAALYNSTTPADRRRSLRQVKEHWRKLNKWCNDFNNSWIKAERIYASGQSDDQLTAKAQKFYDEDYGGVFLQISCWKVVRYQPKWLTYNDELKNPRKRNLGDVGEVGDYISSHIDIEDIPRPKGTKAAKAERSGSGSGKSKKGKGNLPTADNEELDKYAEAYKNRSEVLELQKRISGEKLESAKLIHLASKEKKEAKALEQYTKLVTHDTTKMSDDAKAKHMMAIKFMREQLQKASATTMD